VTNPGSPEAEPTAFVDAAAFDTWLDAHASTSRGIWLKLAKSNSGIPSLTSDEAVDVGLCHGWISGQRKALDDAWYLQRYVPRRRRSRWSQVNVRKAEALIVAGRMRPAGQAEIDAAKADGRWDAAYASQRDAVVPDDLVAALTENPSAARRFAELGRTARYAVILDLEATGPATTRARRLRRAIAQLSER
jgi:uncharacterized protein YdeI (YjbR/CyaY-like superfamily)